MVKVTSKWMKAREQIATIVERSTDSKYSTFSVEGVNDLFVYKKIPIIGYPPGIAQAYYLDRMKVLTIDTKLYVASKGTILDVLDKTGKKKETGKHQDLAEKIMKYHERNWVW
jgi:hypothetical protein